MVALSLVGVCDGLQAASTRQDDQIHLLLDASQLCARDVIIMMIQYVATVLKLHLQTPKKSKSFAGVSGDLQGSLVPTIELLHAFLLSVLSLYSLGAGGCIVQGLYSLTSFLQADQRSQLRGTAVQSRLNVTSLNSQESLTLAVPQAVWLHGLGV
jgi:hypothetical protein